MAKATTKRRSAPQQTADDDIFAHFEAHGRSIPYTPTEPQADPKKDTGQEALLAQIAALQTQVSDLTQRSMMQQPAARQEQTPSYVDPRTIKVSHEGLPDPLDNKDAYNQELTLRINAALEARDHALRQDVAGQSTTQATGERLWNDFIGKYGDWEQHEDLVGLMVEKVLNDAKARGIDTQRYMLQNTQLFFQDVDKALRDRFGKLVESDEDEGETEAALRPDGSDDAGRTGGMFGGLETGGRPTSTKQTQGPDMIADLHAIQRKMGLF
jgi:hypothetical protein